MRTNNNNNINKISRDISINDNENISSYGLRSLMYGREGNVVRENE